MISNRNDIFRCLIIGSCLFIFWGVIIIWIVSYQNLCHALYLTLYFSKYSGVTIIWNSTRSMPWDVPINWNMSSNWHQRVGLFLPCTILVKIYSFDDDEYYWHMKCLFHPFAKFAVANISCLSITTQECLGLSQWFQINADGCKMQEGSLTIKMALTIEKSQIYNAHLLHPVSNLFSWVH